MPKPPLQKASKLLTSPHPNLSAFGWALARRSFKDVAKLVEADPSLVDTELPFFKQSPLSLCLYSPERRQEIFGFLLDHAKVIPSNLLPRALHYDVINMGIVQLLLSKGINPNKREPDGTTAFWVAANLQSESYLGTYDKMELLAMLAGAGVDPTVPCIGPTPKKNNHGWYAQWEKDMAAGTHTAQHHLSKAELDYMTKIWKQKHPDPKPEDSLPKDPLTTPLDLA